MSDESAYSTVPSRMSMSIYTGRTTDSGASKNGDDLVYKPLTFENELFTARVYKRNYRTPILRRLFKGTEQKTSEKTRARTVAQKSAEDHEGSGAENFTIQELQLAQLQHTKAHNAEPSISFAEACEQGNAEIVETFLKSGQDVHAGILEPRGYDGLLDLSAIHVAAKRGHVQVVEILLTYGADRDTPSCVSRKRPFHLAVEGGHIAMVRYLLDKGTDIAAPDDSSAQAIHIAAETGSAGILNFLMDRGAAIDSRMTGGAQPLHVASTTPGRVDVIKSLCRHGADTEAQTDHGCTPLYYACLYEAVDNTEALLELGAAYSPHGPSIFRPALEGGYPQATRLLLERGVDPNRPVYGERTALHGLFKACRAGVSVDRHHLPEFAEIVELLLVYGADVDLQDSNGDTPLHCLCSRSENQIEQRRLRVQLANILLRNMRDVDTVNLAGVTALCLTIREMYGNWLSQSLIDSGARLLVSKPGFEIRLELVPSVCGHLSLIYCHLRQGSNTLTKRLGDY